MFTFFAFSCSNGSVTCLHLSHPFYIITELKQARVHRFCYFFASTFTHIHYASDSPQQIHSFSYKSVRLLFSYSHFKSHSASNMGSTHIQSISLSFFISHCVYICVFHRWNKRRQRFTFYLCIQTETYSILPTNFTHSLYTGMCCAVYKNK